MSLTTSMVAVMRFGGRISLLVKALNEDKYLQLTLNPPLINPCCRLAKVAHVVAGIGEVKSHFH